MHEVVHRCDVAVLGAGPAGLAAATVAAERGALVAVIEQAPWLGGPIWRAQRRLAMPRAARRWLRRFEQSGARLLDETTAFGSRRLLPQEDGATSSGWLIEAERHGQSMAIVAPRVVLALGAQELLLPFPGWTLPNVFGVGGLQLLAKTGWPVQGKRIVVAGSGPLLLAVAASLAGRGARVTDVIEQAPRRRLVRFALALPRLAPAKIVQAMGFQRQLLGVGYRGGCWPVAAEGERQLREVWLSNGRRTWKRQCDYLACGFGLVPSLAWPRLLGCAIDGGKVVVDPWQRTTVEGIFAAGELTGINGVEAALVEGQLAGYAASGGDRGEEVRRLLHGRQRWQRFAEALQATFRLRGEVRELADDDTIVCRCEDVTWGELREQPDVRAAKLQTRCGMGPCQGRVCHEALRVMKGWDADRPRPPVFPVQVGTLAGS